MPLYPSSLHQSVASGMVFSYIVVPWSMQSADFWTMACVRSMASLMALVAVRSWAARFATASACLLVGGSVDGVGFGHGRKWCRLLDAHSMMLLS